MAKTRLSKHMREEVLRAAEEKLFPDTKAKAFEVRQRKAGTSIIRVALPEIKSLAKLPTHWLQDVDHVNSYSGGFKALVPRKNLRQSDGYYLRFEGGNPHISIFFESVRLPHFTHEVRCKFLEWAERNTDHPLMQAYVEVYEEIGAWITQRLDFRAATKSALSAVTTVEELFERWPDAKKYLPKPITFAPISVPAIRFEDVFAIIEKVTGKPVQTGATA